MELTRFGGVCWGRELEEDDATDTRASDQFAATICIGVRPRSSTESDAAPLLSAANACSDPLRITLPRARATPNYRCLGVAAGRAGQRPRSGTSSAPPPLTAGKTPNHAIQAINRAVILKHSSQPSPILTTDSGWLQYWWERRLELPGFAATRAAPPPRQPVGRIAAPCADRGVERTIASLSAL